MSLFLSFYNFVNNAVFFGFFSGKIKIPISIFFNFLLGKANRLPFVPEANKVAPIEAAIPMQIVDTSQFMC